MCPVFSTEPFTALIVKRRKNINTELDFSATKNYTFHATLQRNAPTIIWKMIMLWIDLKSTLHWFADTVAVCSDCLCLYVYAFAIFKQLFDSHINSVAWFISSLNSPFHRSLNQIHTHNSIPFNFNRLTDYQFGRWRKLVKGNKKNYINWWWDQRNKTHRCTVLKHQVPNQVSSEWIITFIRRIDGNE